MSLQLKQAASLDLEKQKIKTLLFDRSNLLRGVYVLPLDARQNVLRECTPCAFLLCTGTGAPYVHLLLCFLVAQ